MENAETTKYGAALACLIAIVRQHKEGETIILQCFERLEQTKQAEVAEVLAGIVGIVRNAEETMTVATLKEP